jgi:hypothetical protein
MNNYLMGLGSAGYVAPSVEEMYGHTSTTPTTTATKTSWTDKLSSFFTLGQKAAEIYSTVKGSTPGSSVNPGVPPPPPPPPSNTGKLAMYAVGGVAVLGVAYLIVRSASKKSKK